MIREVREQMIGSRRRQLRMRVDSGRNRNHVGSYGSTASHISRGISDDPDIAGVDFRTQHCCCFRERHTSDVISIQMVVTVSTESERLIKLKVSQL